MPLQSTNDRSTQNSRGPSPASDTSEDKRPDEKLNYGKLLERKKKVDAVEARTQKKNNKLKRKIAKVTSQNGTSGQPPNKKSKSTEDEEGERQNETAVNAKTLKAWRDTERHYALLEHCFLSDHDLKVISCTKPQDYDYAEWISSKDVRIQYHAYSLRTKIRPDLVKSLKDVGSQALIRDGFNDIRSTKSSLAREKTALLFGGDFDEGVLEVVSAHNDLDLKKINGFVPDNNNGHYKTMDIPVLHDAYSGTFDKTTFLCHPSLLKICVLTFWGRAALSHFLCGKWPAPIIGRVLATQWHLRKVTPGMIAFCAVIARFILSPDVQFQTYGAKSGIAYEDCFNEYINWMHSGLGNKKKRPRKLLKFWNDKLFPGRPHKAGMTKDVEQARRDLADDSTDDDLMDAEEESNPEQEVQRDNGEDDDNM